MNAEPDRAGCGVGPASTPGEAIHDAARALNTVSELADSLPRLLLELNAELLACQKADRREPVQGPRVAGHNASITAARFALTEATTAALTLVRRLADAGRDLSSALPDRDR